MANEKIIVASDKERVALDLALKINETADNEPADRTRSYWLSLYSECLNVVEGRSPVDTPKKP